MQKIYKCRVCGGANLTSVLDLGTQSLTGVFPKSKEDSLSRGSLELFWCNSCGLLQLSESYDLHEMYGVNYGYRSGLNASMVTHLKKKVRQLERLLPISEGDLVLDIGSNDGTLLAAYQECEIQKVGIDPTGMKFKEHYVDGITLIPDFFSAKLYKNTYGSKKAKIITSISMFYDLENPAEFVKDVADILDKYGVWHLEQSYMPSMLRMNSYDTVCHEHLEYYSLKVLKKLLEDHDLKIIDVSMNSINGGSFAVTAAHYDFQYEVNNPIIEWMLGQEERMELDTLKPYQEFQRRVFRHREDLVRLVRSLSASGKKVVGYGASTKGNVLLQFCGFTQNEISCIAEVNPDKFGCYTPGSNIPIMSEYDVKAMKPDYMLVLPWHFRDSILKREETFLEAGGKLIFPMPDIEII